jgi:hypothetical protein
MSDRRPDIDLRTSVRARRLRFDVVPPTSVSFDGAPDYVGESTVERENLPERVREGVTYRDVAVRWRAIARVEGFEEQE